MDYGRIRPDTIDAIRRYVEDGIPPGGFLTAVLSNDLSESFGRADNGNRQSLFEIVSYCYNEIPSTCWGSPEKVHAWVNKKRKERLTQGV